MLCDGLCMVEDALERAVNIMEAFAKDRGYKLVKKLSTPEPVISEPVKTEYKSSKTGWLGRMPWIGDYRR